MQNWRSWLKKIRFFGSVSLLYAFSLGGGWYVLQASAAPPPMMEPEEITSPAVKPSPSFRLVTGKPVRVVLPAYGIDLPVSEGYYDKSKGTWTLSDTRAYYAMVSYLANNHSGNTFIYGHGTDQVFGKLSTNPPTHGTKALVYTSNKHVFLYTFKKVRHLPPDATSVFRYKGSPILTIQTCTGVFSEWRSMYQFNFKKVIR